MDKAIAVISLLAVLFLVARGMPGQKWPIIILGALAVIVLVVAVERGGYWPEGWTTR